MLCEYGCGRKALFYLKFKTTESKWSCSDYPSQCPEVRKRLSESLKGRKSNRKGKLLSKKTREKMSLVRRGIPKSRRYKLNKRITIKQIRDRYPTFSKVEQMRYDPSKPKEERVIQVHCKNHKCNHSKEKGGWFTPTGIQLAERIRQLEHPDGNDGSYFYCSDVCKCECPLFRLRGDYSNNEPGIYTQAEYNIFRKYVFERDNYKCQFCGNTATNVHHERPQKLEPFFSLDPDLSWSCCKECHYKKGHPAGTDCSTQGIRNIICL